MSAEKEEVCEGVAERSSEAFKESQEAILQLVQHIAGTALGRDGELHPNTEFQIVLRSPEGQSEIFEQLILEVCPSGVDQVTWMGWLQGGNPPPDLKKLKKVGPGEERPARTLVRSTRRVKAHENKLAKLRAKLKAEEACLAQVKAYDNAALHWHVVDQLAGIISPSFSMGPAWTVMRALSAYMSDEELDRKTVLVTGKEKERAIAEFRAIKRKDSEKAMEGLDFFSGHEGFERAVRMAILEVVDDFETKREEWTQTGRRRRSKESMDETAHPDAQQDAEKVLEGLKPRF